MSMGFQHFENPSPAIIVEVKKLVANFFDLSIYNLPLLQLIPLLDSDLKIRQVNLFGLDGKGEFLDTCFNEEMSLQDFISLVNEPGNFKPTDVSLEIEGYQSIDSNFSDEIFCTLSTDVELKHSHYSDFEPRSTAWFLSLPE